jgi:HAD superfamily hydrolase (TIGR01459 family)
MHKPINSQFCNNFKVELVMNTHSEKINEVWHNEKSDALSSSVTLTRVIKGIGDLANRYEAFLIDQWGVLHNGQTPYPGVVQCLKRLVWAGKQVIIISNSGKRSEPNEARMKTLGFPRNSYTHLVTSGEIAWQMLATGKGLIGEFNKTPCLHLTSDQSEAFTQGLNFPFVDSIEQAGWILLGGIDDARPPSFYQTMIEEGVARKLPLVCTNPDLTRITPTGLKPSVGAIAQAYQAQGGHVYFIGKPYPEIYKHCRSLVSDLPASRILGIGDSIHHDIVGGQSVGINTLLVLQGVHADHFTDTNDSLEINRRIRKIGDPLGAHPNWAVPSFKW